MALVQHYGQIKKNGEGFVRCYHYRYLFVLARSRGSVQAGRVESCA